MTDAPTLSPLSDAPAELQVRKESWKKETIDIAGADGRTYATIDFAIWSGKAKAEVAGATWALSREKGFTHRRIEVEPEGGVGGDPAELDLDTFRRGGTINLGGTAYEIRASGVFKERWRCERDGQELFAMEESGSLGKGKGDIELFDAGRDDPNLGLLLVLTLHANHASDASSASTAAISGGAVASS